MELVHGEGRTSHDMHQEPCEESERPDETINVANKTKSDRLDGDDIKSSTSASDQDTPPRIGQTNARNARVVRIIHISDTHMRHSDYTIPDGDILIHSGDFGSYNLRRKTKGRQDFQQEVKELDAYFSSLPHKYKIFVAGNHETNFPAQNPRVISTTLKHGIYLQDSFVIIEGIKIYGSPWNNYRWHSNASAFSLSSEALLHHWSVIPQDCDVIVTHLPPYGIMDLASVSPWKKLWKGGDFCESCQKKHATHPFILEHWGCPVLRDTVINIRPAAHLFGHVHGCNGVEVHDNVLFSNAAMKCRSRVNVMDFYTTDSTTCVAPQYSYPDHHTARCTIM